MAGAWCDISKFLRGIQEARQRAIAAALRAVDQFGEHVVDDARQITPVKTGFLQASGTTEPAQISGDMITKLIGFGASYSAAVHERKARHEQGEWKFLSTKIEANRPKYEPFVAGKVKAALG